MAYGNNAPLRSAEIGAIGYNGRAKAKVSVSTTAVDLPTTNLSGRHFITLVSDPTNTVRVYVGCGYTPTSTDYDIYLDPGGHYSWPWGDGVQLEGVTASGTASVLVHEGKRS